MTKGRKPDPTRARRGTGNHPKPGEAKKSKSVVPAIARRLTPAESFPPPDYLPDTVKDFWITVVDDLGGANNIRGSYLPSLIAYCEALAVHQEASAHLHKYGLLVSQEGRAVPNPMIKVQKDAAATMLRYAETLGLTPSARIRLGLMEVTGISLLSSLNASLEGK